MHDPANPAGPSPDPEPKQPDGGPNSYAVAVEKAQQVISLYTEQIMKERRTPGADPARLKHLMAQRQACVADQQVLEDATPQEVARIAAAFDARYQELTQQ